MISSKFFLGARRTSSRVGWRDDTAPPDPRWTLLACILASSLSFIDASVLNIALPSIRNSYSAAAPELQWVVNAYLLPLSALLLLGGALGDRYGRKVLLLIGTSIFALASVVCAVAPSINILFAARGAQGLGAALLLPNSLALLNAAFNGERRGRAVGIWAAAGAAAAAVAPLIGGWLVGTVGWPAIFYINLPFAIGAILLSLRFVAESKEADAGRTDCAGALLATCGLGSATYALTLWSATGHFTKAAIIASGGAVVMLGSFLWTEYRRGERAMMPLTLFENRCFTGLNLLTFLLYAAFGAAMLLIPYVLISGGGYSPVHAGLAMLPLPVLITSLSPMIGGLAARVGPRIPLTLGPLVVAAGMTLSGFVRPAAAYSTAVFPMILIMAVGMTIAVAPLTSSVLGSVEERHVAMASGFNSAVARTGGLFATALLGAVLATSGTQLFAGFHVAMYVSAAACVAAGAVGLTMLRAATMEKVSL